MSKEVHEIEFTVSASQASAFGEWLPIYLKQLLEFPGVSLKSCVSVVAHHLPCYGSVRLNSVTLRTRTDSLILGSIALLTS